jgi:hypothetical protein
MRSGQDGEMDDTSNLNPTDGPVSMLLWRTIGGAGYCKAFHFGVSLGGPLSQFDGHVASFLTLSMRCSGNTIITDGFVSTLARALQYNSIPRTLAGFPPPRFSFFLCLFTAQKTA